MLDTTEVTSCDILSELEKLCDAVDAIEDGYGLDDVFYASRNARDIIRKARNGKPCAS